MKFESQPTPAPSVIQPQLDFQQAARDRLIERLGLKTRETKLLQALDRIAQVRGISDELGNLHVDVPKSEVARVMDASVDTAKRAWLAAERTPYLLVEKSNNAAHYFTLHWPIIFSHSNGAAAPPILTELGGAAGGATLIARGGSFSGRGGSSCTPLNRKNPMFQGGGSTPYGGEGGLIPSSPQGEGWQLAEQKLRECKVGAFSTAIQNAQNGGWSPAEVVQVCEQFLAAQIDGVCAWSNRLLWKHFEIMGPGTPISAEPTKAYAAKLAEREQQRQATILLNADPAPFEPRKASLEETWGELLDALTEAELQELVDQCPAMIRTRFRTNGLTRAIRGPLLAVLARQMEAEPFEV